MMQKKAFYALATLPLFSLALLGPSVASAHGFFGSNIAPEEIATRQQEMFASDAAFLGVSVDEVKEAWAEGKHVKQLAQEKGITAEQFKAKMEIKRQEQMRAQMKALVDKGIITQAQADKRIATMKDQAAKMKDMKGKKGGMGRGGRF